MISLASAASVRQETDQEDENEVAPKMNFDNFVGGDLPNNDQSAGHSFRGTGTAPNQNIDLLNNVNFNQNLSKLANERNRSRGSTVSRDQRSARKQSLADDLQHRQIPDPFEFNNEEEVNNNLQTDEDADFKRAILQMIFLDDVSTLSQLLQIGGANNNQDVYESIQQAQNGGISQLKGYQGQQVNEKIRNLNWHDQHVKTDLDSKITPLCQAAYLGRKRMVETFLENFTYLDLNLETKENCYTPISSACMAGNFDIVCLLAQNGADVNKVDCMQQSPLIYCFSRMNEDENYYENKALALKMANILLQYGADPNQLSHGRTILMNFCRQNYENIIKIQQTMLLEVIKYLMLHGADAFDQKCQKKGMTAYEYALQNQHQSNQRLSKLGIQKTDTIENQIIEIIKNTKQQFFHPKLKTSMSSQKYRQSRNGRGQSSLMQMDNTSRDVVGCCGCGTLNLFSNICDKK